MIVKKKIKSLISASDTNFSRLLIFLFLFSLRRQIMETSDLSKLESSSNISVEKREENDASPAPADPQVNSAAILYNQSHCYIPETDPE